MSSTSENNKRIAKNTFFLYIRTMITMLATLITSRVVLNALGFIDYGLYNVVAGVITLFAFLNNSLGSATSRFLTFELGLNNTEHLKTIFRTAFNIHFGLAIFVVVLCETIGLWIVNSVLTIPHDRLFACNLIYQFVIVSAGFSIMQVPFNAMIIAHERMKVFAFIGMADAVSKLFIAYLISFTVFDKLIFYGALNAVVIIVIYAFYHFYCKQNFEEYNLSKDMDKSLFKGMINYSGWSLFGNATGIAWNTGTNILMNIFFGPVVNAANAIAQQVYSAISTFYSNFTMALNPQIIKTYATGEMMQMKTLIFEGGKFSFFLFMIFFIPVFLETDIILRLWLKDVPEYANIFTKLLMICSSLVGCFGITASMAVQATGKIKNYQITIGCILLLAFPITYMSYKFGATPTSAYIGMIATALFAIFARMFFLKKYLNISYIDYFKNMLWISFLTFVFSVIPPFVVHKIMNEGLLRLLIVSCIALFSSLFFIYILGLSRGERQTVNEFVEKKIKKYIMQKS